MLTIATACSGGSASSSGGRAQAQDGWTCPDDPSPQTEQFVTLWSAALLSPDFQRELVDGPELPGAPQVPGMDAPDEQEQRELATCLADRMAELREQGLGQDPDVEVQGGENVYKGSFVSSTGTPYSADILKELIFNRSALDFTERAGGVPVQPQPEIPVQDPAQQLDAQLPSPPS